MQVFKRGGLRPLCHYFHSTKAKLECDKKNDYRRIVVEPLTQRELISVRGSDAKAFLQGMMTNDIRHLDGRGTFSSIYTLFLNRGGRVLYDAIVYCALGKDGYYVECDCGVSSEFKRYLHQFKVRRKVDIDYANDFGLWVAASPSFNFTLQRLDAQAMISPDPRLSALGARIFTPPNETLESLQARFSNSHKGVAVPADEVNNYRTTRYMLGVGEGIDELPPGKCFPFEANADYLHGVSFQKGCYLGQELTARTFHTGVVRKRLMPLCLNAPLKSGANEIHTEAGYKVGFVRGYTGSHALGLLNVEKVLAAGNLTIAGDKCHVVRPNWWPPPAPDQRKSAMERVSLELGM